jgi:nucleoside-diphosphate-sugar epimerase
VRCVAHPAAAGQTFLVSDGEDLSTPELIRRIARAMGTSARLLPAPRTMVHMAGRLVGRSAEVGRLLGSLQVDIQHTRRVLEWAPPVTIDQGLRRAVAGA